MNNTQATQPTSIWAWFGKKFNMFVLWFIAKVFGLVLALFLGLIARQRMSHNNGIAAEGFLDIVDNPEFPAHKFFKPGRRFPLRIRHATATFYDDAMSGIRSMSIKFSHEHFESPFDIEMNTGAASLFWSAASFLQFARLRKEKYGIEYPEYYRRYPEGLTGAQVALRRDPDSFHNLHYYCKTPFLFIADDGTRYYAKYRVKPSDNEPETGKIKDPSEWDTCNQRILPHETRGRNYLKDEYIERVTTKGARYRMQIQLLKASEGEDPEIFNNMVAWDEKKYPWMDLAVLEVDCMLDWTDSNLTSFSLNNMPKTLGIIPAESIHDYNSLNYMRSHSEIARKARIFAYKLFGGPKEIPDNDNRNSSTIN
jgi:arachidonate 5-lipoxygenase